MSGGRGLWWLGFGLLGALLSFTGCVHSQEVPDEEQVLPFRLGREDVVEISVYRDPELSRTVPVRPDGMISLPIVGEVLAAGRTTEELRDEILQRLQGYVRDPAVVSIIVQEVNSTRFFVVGEVMRPGAYPLHGDLTVLQGLALAGGLGEFSARRHVTLVRGLSGDRYRLSLAEIWAGKGGPRLRAGDTLVVP